MGIIDAHTSIIYKKDIHTLPLAVVLKSSDRVSRILKGIRGCLSHELRRKKKIKHQLKASKLVQVFCCEGPNKCGHNFIYRECADMNTLRSERVARLQTEHSQRLVAPAHKATHSAVGLEEKWRVEPEGGPSSTCNTKKPQDENLVGVAS